MDVASSIGGLALFMFVCLGFFHALRVLFRKPPPTPTRTFPPIAKTPVSLAKAGPPLPTVVSQPQQGPSIRAAGPTVDFRSLIDSPSADTVPRGATATDATSDVQHESFIPGLQELLGSSTVTTSRVRPVNRRPDTLSRPVVVQPKRFTPQHPTVTADLDSWNGMKNAQVLALASRVAALTQSDSDLLAGFDAFARGLGWRLKLTIAADVRTMEAMSHANLEEKWKGTSALIEAAVLASPLATSPSPVGLDRVLRTVRWAILGVALRDFRDELQYGGVDYALLTLPWTWAFGALHPADITENPWSEFLGSALELPRPTPPSPVSSRMQGPAPIVASPEPVRNRPGLFHVHYWTDRNGAPVASESKEEWLRARRTGVTATDARMLVKANGLPSTQRAGLLRRKLDGEEGQYFAAFENGIEREPIIAQWVSENFTIEHNTHLCIGENARHLATPDGIGDGVICEIKTSVDPLEKAVRTYRDQLQWQLHVTASERVLLVVENRHTRERDTRWIGRDEERISTLIRHANSFLRDLDAGLELQVQPGPVEPAVVAPHRNVRFEQEPQSVAPRPRNPARSSLQLKEWSAGESSAAVNAYAHGATVATISKALHADAAEVVRELSRWLLVTDGDMVNEAARRFGFNWEAIERKILLESYFQGIRLALLAESMQRDQLGLAFQLFDARVPTVDPALIRMLEVRAGI